VRGVQEQRRKAIFRWSESLLSRRIISYTFQSKNKPDLRLQKPAPSAHPGAKLSGHFSDPLLQNGA